MTAWATRPDLESVAEVATALLRRSPGIGGERAAVVHDLDLLEARIAELVAAFPPTALHAVAVKANPVVELLRVAVAAGTGLEAASYEEVQVALAAGCPPERIVFDSPAKTPDELAAALAAGMTVNVDSLSELRTALALPHHERARIGVRVAPEVSDGAIAATSVGGRGSRFGVRIDELLEDVVPLMETHPVLQGLHVHVGSQGCSLDLLAEAAARVAGLLVEIRQRCGPGAVSFVDIGGGLPAVYREGDTAPTIAEYADRLRVAAPSLFDGSVQLVTELGRSLLAGTAVALTRVHGTKHVDGDDVVVTHLGADFLLRPAYRPDEWSHEFGLLDGEGRARTPAGGPWTVAGPLCFAGDVIGRGVPLPDPTPGDWLVIFDVGAYTLSMWSRHCSRGMPPVLGVRDHGRWSTVLRAGERPEDVARFWGAGTT